MSTESVEQKTVYEYAVQLPNGEFCCGWPGHSTGSSAHSQNGYLRSEEDGDALIWVNREHAVAAKERMEGLARMIGSVTYIAVVVQRAVVTTTNKWQLSSELASTEEPF